MRKTTVVLNCVMLALFGVAFLGLGVQYPGAVGGGFLLILLPYAAALLALKAKPNSALIGGSIFLNAMMVVVSVVYSSLGMLTGQPAMALMVALLLLPSPVLNCVVLKWAWDRTRAASRPLTETAPRPRQDAT